MKDEDEGDSMNALPSCAATAAIAAASRIRIFLISFTVTAAALHVTSQLPSLHEPLYRYISYGGLLRCNPGTGQHASAASEVRRQMEGSGGEGGEDRAGQSRTEQDRAG